ncbi:FAD/FMN-containing dehydrogenase [Leucobacter luti]|uniref:FAD/FMN-containing dehydrogenase n=2 Tax=Leucobacter luti TaxID=340320 RepID=A0A4V3CXD0_9MICO|nr:FAD/FMN-containing dehydrogenase [Leucobacter luti]
MDTTQLFADLRARGIEIDDDSRRLSEYSFDASNYRIRPKAVVFPHTVEEVRSTLRAAQSYKIPVTTRGGGTSMAGNAVGHGLILDLSRRFTEVADIDIDDRSVWVGSGVVLGELRSVVERGTQGALTFAPDPSSLSRATIGGSIGNDACGNHSVAYGRMTQHVQEIEAITIDGAYLRLSPGGITAIDPKDTQSVARAEQLTAELRDLVQANLAALRVELQTIPRQVSGFHLGHLLPEEGFDVAAALAGSEGTIAVVTRALVKLVPRPPATALLCLGYASTIDSARDVMEILASKPTAIEGLDRSIVEIMRHRRGAESVDGLPRGEAFLMVEFSAETVESGREQCMRLLEAVTAQGRVTDAAVVTDSEARAKLWRVREDGAGLSSRRIDGKQTWPGWEDSAVAPERLADYLSELLPLVDKYQYSAFMYGHFGAGCIHMRLDYDLRSRQGRNDFEAFTREAAELVVAHGGSLSGEHGDGRARSELLSVMYSPEMIELFAAFKYAWDPENLLNPGIIVDPDAFTASLALAGTPKPGPTLGEVSVITETATMGLSIQSRTRLPLASPYVGNAHACIGVGRCRATSGGFMCPSYRATKDEKDSTRGRARVLQELTRANKNSLDGWSSPEVRDALDLCLSCKACSSDCPTGVDIAEAKSELIDEHYRGRIRPFTHYSIGWLPRWLPLIGHFSGIANAGARIGLLRRIADWLGVSARRRLPAFQSSRDIRRRLDEASFDSTGEILIFADSFTKAFRPDAIAAAARVLGDTGRTVGCTADACCGLTWISTGQREGARRRLARLIRKFDDGTNRDIVVLEPSCAAAIRDEGPKMVGGEAADRVAARVRSFSVAVDEAIQRGWRPSTTAPSAAVLQTHCHEHAVFGSGAQKRVLDAWGVPLVFESSSCCGVAGNFGFESEHFEMSMQVAEHSIVPALRQAPEGALVLTDGFSCTMQVSQIDPDLSGQHLALALDPARALAETPMEADE